MSPETTPRGNSLDVDSIEELYRMRGVVVFVGTSPEGKLKPRCALRVREMRDFLPGYLEALAVDAYYTINSRHDDKLETWRRGHGKEKEIADLNATYLDFDLYREGVSWAEGKARLARAVADGLLPEPSVIADSGRGMWGLWMLRDETDPSLPVAANSATLQRYKRIELKMRSNVLEHVAAMGLDRACIDATRLTRIPGSINGKAEAGRPVSYTWNVDGVGAFLSYTLPDLERILCIEAEPQRPALKLVESAPRPALVSSADAAQRVPVDIDNLTEAQRHGYAGKLTRWQNVIRIIEALDHSRGGFAKGTRTYALFAFAIALSNARIDKALALQRAREMGARCSPPYSPSECERLVREGSRPRQSTRGNGKRPSLRHDELAAWLRVTPDEHDMLRASGIPLLGKPLTNAEQRRRIELELWPELERVLHREPSVREMVAALGGRGIRACIGTVHGDFVALKPARVRSRTFSEHVGTPTLVEVNP